MLCFPRLGDYGYLGNAMFQYAALLGVADKTGLSPVYDFNKKGNMCTLHEIFNLNKVENMPSHEQVHGIRKVIKEPNFHFSEDMFSVEDNVGLNGYFQSEKYFKHIEKSIRSEFKFSRKVSDECDNRIKILKDQTNNSSMIGIHVRLGDYLKLEHLYVPLIKTDYYKKAVEFFDDNIKEDKTYVICSDNVELCKQSFQGTNFLFASEGTPEQDMCLLSKCNHIVMANSSFSWWAAWLNNNKDKKVISPSNWFVPNENDSKNTKDLYCDDWIKM